jgi:ketosteroid isomerase-like protein
MSSPEENVALVRRAVDAYQRGDIETVLGILDSEVVVYQPPELPNAGTYKGHEGFMTWIGAWLEAWEEFTIEIERIEPVGERHVVVDMLSRGVGKGSGIEVEQTLAYMWELRDGKAVAQHLYPTWDDALAVARERENSE